MNLSQAIKSFYPTVQACYENLANFLSPELIEESLKEAGIARIRKRKIPLADMVWAIVGMSIFRHLPMNQVINRMNIVLPGTVCCTKCNCSG